MTTPNRSASPVRAGAWRDADLPVPERVELLLGEMTLEEKLAQLGSRGFGSALRAEADPDMESTLNVAPMQGVFAAEAGIPLAEASRHGLGRLTRVYGSAPVSPADGAAELV